jgi:hypothetical protein
MALGTISAMALVSALPERKLIKEFLESEIDTVEYNRFGDTNTHCTIKTKSGFSFTGESACVDPNNFDQKIGEKFAYENAFNKMWTPYGLWLHKALAEFDNLPTNTAQEEWLATGIKELCQGNILPKDEQCSVSEDFSFGHAIACLKAGHRVAREGWNGKGMFLYYVPQNKYPASRNEHGTMVGVFEDDMVPYGAYIAMKTAQNNVVPWLASQTDVLAEDWQIVE